MSDTYFLDSAPDEQLYLRIGGVCRRYGLGRTKVAELIKSGRLRAIKIGSATLIDVMAADAFFAIQPAPKNAAPYAGASATKPRARP